MTKTAMLLLALISLGPCALVEGAERLQVGREPGAVVIRSAAGQVLMRYQIERPADSPLSVESGCYFHPLTTPKGVVLTDVAPASHLFQRGIFLGWAEMHGRKDGDFWGGGGRAATSGRRILSQGIKGAWAREGRAGFRARSAWMAGDDPLLQEELEVEFRVESSAHVLDLVYQLKSDEDMTLARSALGGFCVQTRAEGTIEAHSPLGLVRLRRPDSSRPDSDWPDVSWYDFTLHLANGVSAGLAVINHPKNPPTLWHNDSEARMLNPAITALWPVLIEARKPLVLRYRVVAHDGAAPSDLLDRLASEWRRK